MTTTNNNSAARDAGQTKLSKSMTSVLYRIATGQAGQEPIKTLKALESRGLIIPVNRTPHLATRVNDGVLTSAGEQYALAQFCGMEDKILGVAKYKADWIK